MRPPPFARVWTFGESVELEQRGLWDRCKDLTHR
jgi:hypothetical protein